MPDFTVSIVTLCYNKYHLTNQFLYDLYKNERENITEVIIVDNHSTDDDAINGLAWWNDNGMLPIKLAPQLDNLGFLKGANIGLKLATREMASKHLIFLISNDVRIQGKFIDKSADILFGARRSFVGNKLLFGDTGWNNFDGRLFQYLEGYFLAATSDGWKDLGYFDEDFAPYDFEDMDLSTTALKKGYRLEPLNNPAISHAGAGTYGYNEVRKAQTERNREVFRNKWLK